MSLYEQFPSLKALFILEALSKNGGYTGINEICEMTGMSQSSVHRIINEMTQIGYVEKNERYRKYRVGIRASVLASHFMQSSSLVNYAREEMQRLNQLTGETIHLMTISGGVVIYLNKINTVHTIGLMSYIGKTNPIHCTSGGKCMMAFMDQKIIDEYLEQSLRERYTPQTLVSKEELLNEFEAIRRQGYALDRNEHHANITCIAGPIFDRTSKPAASISVAAPLYRFPIDKAESLAPEIIRSCQIVSERLANEDI